MSEDMTERAKAVQAKYESELMAKPHVQGVAVGLAKKDGQYTGEIAVVVMVDQKVPASELSADAAIPGELDGVLVDVQEMGQFAAQ